MARRIIYAILLLLVLADLCYSFEQHLSQPLDGDMAWNIVPSGDVRPILASPLGTAVFQRSRPYSNPNRFFCHWAMKAYFDRVPLALQEFVQPVDSIYLSCALAKITIQVLLLLLLAMAISGTANLLRMDFILAAALVTPLFQTNGYRDYMGIIDPSVSYTFFYALPCAFLLLYFMPFIFQYYHDKKPVAQPVIKTLWIPFAVVLSLSGPLNTGIVLIFALLAFVSCGWKHFTRLNGQGVSQRLAHSIGMIPRNYWYYFVPIGIFSLYSLYIGRYNLNNVHIPLADLYARLPEGVFYQFTQKLGFPLLFAILALNLVLIARHVHTPEGRKILDISKWIGLFALLYIVLLPLGGYRDYRPNVLRYDTIMPVTLSLIFLFGISSLCLVKTMKRTTKMLYIPLLVAVLLVYTNSDKAEFDKNKCERSALNEISGSADTVVELHEDCPVLSWEKTGNPEDSELNAQLLLAWKVTTVKKRYFNK